VLAQTVLNNWQLSGITSFISGTPSGVGWSTTYSTDITGTATQTARIVVTGNPVLPKSEQTFSRFGRAQASRTAHFGVCGRRQLRASPGAPASGGPRGRACRTMSAHAVDAGLIK
jgi:hypothetical protein